MEETHFLPSSNNMVCSTVEAIARSQRSDGVAAILAIGTATPPNVIDQATYPDYYFRVTNSEDKVDLKNKFRNFCEKSTVKKRYTVLTEELLKKNPNIATYEGRSHDARQEIVLSEVSKLGKLAAEKAVEEWGQPMSKITHLIFCTTTGVDMPGVDYQFMKLLGLNHSVKRLMLYHLGCFGGGTVLRFAKDLAENNRGARVLVVCSENTVHIFRGPGEHDMSNLVGQSLFGDGASAMVVGSDPIGGSENPIFEIVSAAQTVLPDSEGAIGGHMTEAGLTFYLLKSVPDLVSKNIEECLTEAFEPLGISDWNSIFWAAHPGGPAILNQLEKKVGLKPERLEVSRHVLSEYGNMSSATVIFILDEMRRRSIAEKRSTTGEGLEWGVLFGFGPGLTVETVVLHSLTIK